MRIITDLNQPSIDALKWLCDNHNISRAEAIRRAVVEKAEAEKETTEKKQADKMKVLLETFGAWKDSGIGDAQEYVNKIRSEWDREWDSVKGEWIYNNESDI